MKKEKIPKRIIRKNDDKIYLSNKNFLKVIEDFLEKRKENPNLHCTEELGEMFLQLVNKIASKHNFSNYTFLDEMKSEAIVQCIWKAPNFNPEKSQNPFSYFTTIIFNSFIKIIKEEKNQSYIKDSLFKEFQEELYNSKEFKINLKTEYNQSEVNEE